MNSHSNHTDLSSVEAQSKRFFSGGTFDWNKNNSDVWNDLEPLIAHRTVGTIRHNFRVAQWAVAAAIVLLLGMTSFLRFYSKTVTSTVANHLAMILPDGSSVELNASSTLRYHPYWWRFDRKITFEGEGFFEVKKGKQFTVVSRLGKTQVLGTSFNIYSRDEVYRVTCITGRVKVTSGSKNEVILKPQDKASVSADGQIKRVENIETLPEISWKNNMFRFTAVPVREVFSEIERQYGITIESKIDNQTLYSGNFSKNQKVEDVLGYICPALGFRYIHQSDNVYTIIPDEQ
ncbi:MAG TPA: FecR domain-containing protein [Prolixibacteraceae bacterium]|nr:FecR domain-containing protein [Prolixibacteraceae bacterium]